MAQPTATARLWHARCIDEHPPTTTSPIRAKERYAEEKPTDSQTPRRQPGQVDVAFDGQRTLQTPRALPER